MTLTEFLLARIAEDEAVAHQADPWLDLRDPSDEEERLWERQPHEQRCGWRMGEGLATGCTCDYPARVLAECEAKRRIVEWASVKVARFTPSLDTPPRFAEVTFRAGRVYADPHRQVDITDEYHRWADEHSGYAHVQVLQWLALPYADHDDYDEDWRP